MNYKKEYSLFLRFYNLTLIDQKIAAWYMAFIALVSESLHNNLRFEQCDPVPPLKVIIPCVTALKGSYRELANSLLTHNGMGMRVVLI